MNWPFGLNTGYKSAADNPVSKRSFKRLKFLYYQRWPVNPYLKLKTRSTIYQLVAVKRQTFFSGKCALYSVIKVMLFLRTLNGHVCPTDNGTALEQSPPVEVSIKIIMSSTSLYIRSNVFSRLAMYIVLGSLLVLGCWICECVSKMIDIDAKIKIFPFKVTFKHWSLLHLLL